MAPLIADNSAKRSSQMLKQRRLPTLGTPDDGNKWVSFFLLQSMSVLSDEGFY